MSQNANTHPGARMDDGVPFSAWTAFCRHLHGLTGRDADPRDSYHLAMFRHFAAGWKAASDAVAEANQHLSPGATPSEQPMREQDTGGPAPDGDQAAPGETCYGFDALESPLFARLSDAVEWYAGRFEGVSTLAALDLMEWPLVVDEFRLMPKPTAERALGWWIEDWDADYTHESFGPTVPTPELVALMQQIIDRMKVTNCETTGKTVTVTKDWALNMMGGLA